MLGKAVVKVTVGDFVCPKCGECVVLADQDVLTTGMPQNGKLICSSCEEAYPIRAGVPYFARDLGEQERTATTFGFEWGGFWKGLFDKNDVGGLNFSDNVSYFVNSLGITEADLDGKKVLDAGTGSARFPRSIQNLGCQIYAVDIHGNLGVVSKQIDNTESVTFCQADLFNLPFKDAFFDIAWSSGVIHHTPDAKQAFESIAKKVKPGGRLFVSVYGKDLHHYRLFRRLLPFARYLPPIVTYIMTVILVVPLYFAFNGALLVIRTFNKGGQPPYKFLGFSIENTTHKSFFSILLNLFDQLHPKFQSEHSIDEVQGWFETNGFHQIVATESVGMVAMRGVRV